MKDINTIIIKSINPDWLIKQELTLTGFKINEKKNQIQLTVAITKDGFKYDKVGVSNVFEKFSIYPENVRTEQFGTLKLGKKVKLQEVTGVVTYGEFNNNLSLTGTVQFYD